MQAVRNALAVGRFESFVLDQAGLEIRLVGLPSGHDPNSYFVAGASAQDFTR
jgi:hypothetical protein